MFIPRISRYRIVEKIKFDDSSKFYVQHRTWYLGWEYFRNSSVLSSNEIVSFNRHKDANDWLYDRLMSKKKNKVVKVKKHSFDLVFEKLRRKND